MRQASALFFLVLGLGAGVGCKRAQRVSGSAGATTEKPRALASASVNGALRRIRRAGAFDLTTTTNGAALVWANGETSVLSLSLVDDEAGVRAAVPLLPREADAGSESRGLVEEVAAVARGDELGVAVIEKQASEWRALGTVRHTSSAAGAKYLDLGNVAGPLASERGNIAIAKTRDGDLLVLSRGMKTECIRANERHCVSFGFHRLEAKLAIKRGLPMIVPEPCERNPILLSTSRSTWQYAICSRSSARPVTTLFTIQNEPAYARADTLLDGCWLLGAVRFQGDLLVAGECAGQRKAVRISGETKTDVPLNLLDTACKSGQLIIRQPGADGLTLTLAAPLDHLEALLPPAVAPAGARAVWTGKRLVVAYASGGELAVDRYRCDSSLLRKVEDVAE